MNDRRNKIIGLIISILIHIAILLPFLISSNGIKVHKPKPPPDEPHSIELTLLPMATAEDPKLTSDKSNKKATYPTDTKICAGRDKTYVGIGFVINFGSDMIIHIPEFYPAYKAGMRLGDLILNPYEVPVNGWIDYDVMRHTERLHFHVKVDNICYNEG